MKSVIIDGIKVNVDKSKFTDTKFTRMAVKVNVINKKFNALEDKDDGWELLDQLYDITDQMYTFALGDKQYQHIVDKLREKNGGSVTDEQIGNFFTKLGQKVNPDSKK